MPSPVRGLMTVGALAAYTRPAEAGFFMLSAKDALVSTDAIDAPWKAVQVRNNTDRTTKLYVVEPARPPRADGYSLMEWCDFQYDGGAIELTPHLQERAVHVHCVDRDGAAHEWGRASLLQPRPHEETFVTSFVQEGRACAEGERAEPDIGSLPAVQATDGYVTVKCSYPAMARAIFKVGVNVVGAAVGLLAANDVRLRLSAAQGAARHPMQAALQRQALEAQADEALPPLVDS